MKKEQLSEREPLLLLNLPVCESSPHEAQRMADLMTPFQGEEIKELCHDLKTTPTVETKAMFGNDVSFYRLHRNSAKALAVKLRNVLESQR